MYRQILMASVGALALTGSAVAADLPLQPPPSLPPAPLFTWTGLYVGGQIGYAWGTDHASFTDPFVYVPFTFSPGGVIGGAHIGYNLQLGPWVAGIEGDVDGTSISQTRSGFFFGDSSSTKTNIQGSIRARAGYAFDHVLLYATGGAAFGGFQNNYTTPFGYDSVSRTRSGWTVGGGLEYAVTNNWSIRAEYRYSGFRALQRLSWPIHSLMASHSCNIISNKIRSRSGSATSSTPFRWPRSSPNIDVWRFSLICFQGATNRARPSGRVFLARD